MIRLRDCACFEEYEACVRLQVETWGYDASDVIPRKAFIVATDTDVAALLNLIVPPGGG